ncbi:DNA protecting protein DprA [Lysobacter enzymogenes]|uniref:DNA protecting protein DprA n=1 Tax=Lysobacter enzymogenes TaxID=69 RepID=A0A0S2DB76_LYSEN|nr:DNA-processing protein DprA [Lysobacter enzymogenes]ALN55711.1 DNA protecting protein DprA [Lysobacter enzymogenes]
MPDADAPASYPNQNPNPDPRAQPRGGPRPPAAPAGEAPLDAALDAAPAAATRTAGARSDGPIRSEADALALLRLLAAGGSSAARRALLDACGGAAAALAAGPSAWSQAALSTAQVARLRAPTGEAFWREAGWTDDADRRLLDWLARPDRQLIAWTDPDYPALLRRAPNPPLALFVAGEPGLLWHPAVAVVGSRSPTPAGSGNAAGFARALARSGLAVTSGLAAGIDATAHRAALDAGGLTVAVLGTGPDLAYPRRHADLLARIAAEGAVASEYPPGTQARPAHFPARNRIVAGLSLGTLVVEAAERSGALITARLAAECGREVFAVPGSIHNPLARGCHRLIREGAGLVESAAEVAAALAPVAAELADGLRRRLGAPIDGGHAAVIQAGQDGSGPVSGDADPAPAQTDFADPDYQSLWNALGFDPTGMDELVHRTGLTTAELSSMLLVMELEGRVAAQHGRYFRNR